MPRTPSRSRRLVTAASWPAGIALTSWAYMWRITPLHRRELAGSMDHDAPPPLPPGTSRDEAQLTDAQRRLRAAAREAELAEDRASRAEDAAAKATELLRAAERLVAEL